MKAIRRFTVRTVLPESLAALDELPRTSAGRGMSRPAACSRRSTATVGVDEPRSDRAARRGQARAAERAAGDEVHRNGKWPRRRTARLPDRAALVPGLSMRRSRSATSRPSSASRRRCPVLGRPRHPRRRPPQVRERPRRADHRRGPLLPRRLLPPGDLARGLAAESYPVLDPDGLPLSVLRHPDGTAAHVTLSLPDGKALTARVWRVAVGRITLLLLDTESPRTRMPCARSPTASTVAAASTACCRSCCSASAACARSSSTRS